jgi:hypothetical protein
MFSLTAGRSSSSSSLVIRPRYLKSRTVSISSSPILNLNARLGALVSLTVTPEHAAARASWELAFFFDDDFVVKVPVHEMSPHAVPVLDSYGAFGALARAVSVLHAYRVGNFFCLFFFDFDVSFVFLFFFVAFLFAVILRSVIPSARVDVPKVVR